MAWSPNQQFRVRQVNFQSRVLAAGVRLFAECFQSYICVQAFATAECPRDALLLLCRKFKEKNDLLTLFDSV